MVWLLGVELAHAVCVGGPPSMLPTEGEVVPPDIAVRVRPDENCPPVDLVLEIDGRELRQTPEDRVGGTIYLFRTSDFGGLTGGEHTLVVRSDPPAWQARRRIVVEGPPAPPVGELDVGSLTVTRTRLGEGQHLVQIEIKSEPVLDADAYTLVEARHVESPGTVFWPLSEGIPSLPPSFNAAYETSEKPGEVCAELVRYGISGDTARAEACAEVQRESGCSSSALPPGWPGLIALVAALCGLTRRRTRSR